MLKLTHNFGQMADLPMHWVEVGEGVPVVLLHDCTQTWDQWRPLIPALGGNYRVIVPDLRSCGDTGRSASGFDIKTVAADVGRLLDGLGCAEAHVIGHGRGGLIGYYLAATQPARVRSLTVLESNFPGTASENLADFTHPGHASHIPFLSNPVLPQELPVMAISGDRSLGRGMIDSVRRFAPGATGIVMADCGHLIPEEHPHQLAELVSLFVRRANRRRLPRSVPAAALRSCVAGAGIRAAG